MISPNYPLMFTQKASIISPPTIRKSQADITKEKIAKEAEIARQKAAEKRNVNDYISIGMDTVNKIKDNTPVVYANPSHKLNYMS